MKKRGFGVIASLMATVCMTFGFAACGEEHTHVYGDWQIVTESTCTKKGSEKRSCECGDEQVREIDFAPHTEELVPGTATCTENGLTDGKKCSVCGETLEAQEEITALGHTEEVVSGTAATCTENGLTDGKKCSVCGETLEAQEEITAPGHTLEGGHCLNCDYTYSTGLEYAAADGGYSVVGIGTCTDFDIIIPSTHEGLPVISIGQGAFYGCSSLTSIVIPDSVTSIGSSAFSGCSSLTQVHISDVAAWCGIKFVDGTANPLFEAHNLYLNGELVTNLVIPDGVTEIGKDAFRSCSSLTSIVIPDSVTTIGLLAFEGCSSLTSVHISDIAAWCGIKFVDDNANPLYWARNLYLNGELVTNLVIPDSVISIENLAFYGCSSLTSIVIPDRDNVISIGDSAFSGCSSLTSVIIGNGVISIGYSAFSGCSSLTSILIPDRDNVTTIGDFAFYYCSSLTSVIIGNGVISIGDHAFRGCSSLTSIVIPDSVTSIGSDTFWYCESLTEIIFNGTTAQWKELEKKWDSDWDLSIGDYTVRCTNGTLKRGEF